MLRRCLGLVAGSLNNSAGLAAGRLIDGKCIIAAGHWQEACQRAWASSSAASAAGLKAYKPTTASFRGRIITKRDNLWGGAPFKQLTEGVRKSGGRNSTGTVTTWHRGGGAKRLYRLIDFQRDQQEVAAQVQRLEYDPNRSARIALLQHQSGGEGSAYSYILAPAALAVGDAVRSGPAAAIRPGNALPLINIPVGQAIHNIELKPGAGGQLVRAAGTSAVLVSKNNTGYVTVRLPSGEQRLVLERCMATIGSLSNAQHKNRKLGRAGANRWLGRRPTVRGVAMNSVDHPHGGGRGKSKGRISQTPWGVPTKGYRTRKNVRTDKFVRLARR